MRKQIDSSSLEKDLL